MSDMGTLAPLSQVARERARARKLEIQKEIAQGAGRLGVQSRAVRFCGPPETGGSRCCPTAGHAAVPAFSKKLDVRFLQTTFASKVSFPAKASELGNEIVFWKAPQDTRAYLHALDRPKESATHLSTTPLSKFPSAEFQILSGNAGPAPKRRTPSRSTASSSSDQGSWHTRGLRAGGMALRGSLSLSLSRPSHANFRSCDPLHRGARARERERESFPLVERKVSRGVSGKDTCRARACR